MGTSQFKKFLTKKNTEAFLPGVLVALILVAIIVVVINFAGKTQEKGPVAQTTEKCVPVPGEGKQTYNIRTDKPKDFEIVQVDVDPIDVKEGETQTITVKVKDKGNNTITKESGVLGSIKTDNKTTVAAFKLLRAEDEIAQDGSRSLVTFWEGLWTRDDANCKTYMETFAATNDKGDEAKVDLAFK